MKYYYGEGVPEDEAEAVKWYRKKAAEWDWFLFPGAVSAGKGASIAWPKIRRIYA